MQETPILLETKKGIIEATFPDPNERPSYAEKELLRIDRILAEEKQKYSPAVFTSVYSLYKEAIDNVVRKATQMGKVRENLPAPDTGVKQLDTDILKKFMEETEYNIDQNENFLVIHL